MKPASRSLIIAVIGVGTLVLHATPARQSGDKKEVGSRPARVRPMRAVRKTHKPTSVKTETHRTRGALRPRLLQSTTRSASPKR